MNHQHGTQTKPTAHTGHDHHDHQQHHPQARPESVADLDGHDTLAHDHSAAEAALMHDHAAATAGGHHEHVADHADHGAHETHDGHGGHGGHAGHAAAFERLFWISLVLSVPVLLFSEMLQEWLNFSMPEFAGSDLLPPILGTVVFIVGGRVFLEGGAQELRDRKPGMMALISLAITVAFVTSLLSTFEVLDLEFWWELVLLIDIMLLGHWLEMRAIGQASDALSALASLLPDSAERVGEDGATESIPVAAVVEGDRLLVRPGGRVPVDGTIVRGEADLDESMLTGESRPVSRGEGDRVVAGSVVAGSSIHIVADAIGENTALAGIQRLVAEAQQSKSRAQALADRFAGLLFYVAVLAAAITFVVWTLLGDIDNALVRTITVLVISCPHALGLAIPLVIAMSTAASARQGVLVRDRRALEKMRTIDTVVFDKTGTLTEGEHEVSGIASVSGNDDDVLRLAAAVERESEHPLARAIVRAAEARGLAVPVATSFQAVAGRGVAATVDGVELAVGGPRLLQERGLQVPDAIAGRQEAWASRGASVLSVIRGDEVIGLIALEDQVRNSARVAVDQLHRRGIRTIMMTGDARNVASHVADELGIDEVLAEVLPEYKSGEVEKLQRLGRTVVMVGDGVNDAPALTQADVGLAIGAGTDVAIESADVVLASSDPRAVDSVIRLSVASYRKMIQNLWWAAGYNLVAIPLAAGVLAWAGVVMPPAVGAVLMSVSTIIVAINAMTLRRLDLSPGAES
jgi:Cu2+-exporting ATPase